MLVGAEPLRRRLAADVRDPGVRARQDAARDRGRRSTSPRSRSRPACAAAELEIDVRYRAAPRLRRRRSSRAPRAPRAASSSPTTGRRIDEQVAELLAGHRVGLAESCTGGLLAARLTEPPGASAYFAGGVVAYSNEAKTDLLGVAGGPDRGARRRLARGRRGDGRRRARAVRRRPRRRRSPASPGPDGGTEEKPVGYVCFCVSRRRRDARPRPGAARRPRRHPRPLGRVAMHMMRRLLSGEDLPL